jgi:hypothetical protein
MRTPKVEFWNLAKSKAYQIQPPEGHLLEVVVEARVSGTQSELVPEL